MCVMNVSVQNNKYIALLSSSTVNQRRSTPQHIHNLLRRRSYCCHSVTLFRVLAKQHLFKHILLQLQYN